MNTILEHLTGMNTMTDQVIATDFLIAAKNSVITYALALTETATPEIKDVLRRQLEEAILTHEQISNYMVQNGLYHPYEVKEQLQLDMTNIQTALNLVSQ
ncbi:spore coat protein [Paenibacillus validus]|uniref:Spore coat protein n=1 Tax=Paenibacillus validus TaxID=44253 RepID=A0A7X3CVB1_9BACL|nr:MULTISPECIES: spore coat protein [Paenibacillus]MED4601532.1 spore coat protein [Paenibacillus validus]MUG73601.1 spore coat protein [Paenibacillus validus]